MPINSRIGLLLAFCLFLTSGYSLTASDIFVSLDKNYADLTGGYAEFTLKSPITATFDASKLNIYTRWNNTPTTSLNIYIQKNVSYQVPIYSTVFVNKTCSNNVTNYDCSYYNTTQTGTKTVYKLEWRPLGTESFVLNKLYKFRVEGKWKATIGKVSRDWIPYLDVAGVKYNMTSWAWWNTSWRYARGFNINETSGVNLQDYTFNFTFDSNALVTAGKLNSTLSDLRVVNVTNSVSLPVKCINNNTANTTCWFMDSISALAKNEYMLYYGNPGQPDIYSWEMVYLFYDDFDDGSLNTTKWAFTGGTPTEGGGILILDASGEYVGSDGVWPGFDSFMMKGSNYSLFFDWASGRVNYMAWISVFPYSAFPSPSFNDKYRLLLYSVGFSPYYEHSDSVASGIWYNACNTTIQPMDDNEWIRTKQTYTTHDGVYEQIYNRTNNVLKTTSSFIADTPALSAFNMSDLSLNFTLENRAGSASYYDNVILRKWAFSEPSFELEEKEYSSLMLVDLEYPSDMATNTTNNIRFGYNVTSYTGGAISGCSLYINGSFAKANSTPVVNSSINYIDYHFANSGSYSWLIGCYAEINANSSSRTLILTEYSMTGSATAYELTRQLFNLTLTFSNYTYSNVGLIYDGVYYPATSLGDGVWNTSVLVPILQVNNTALSYYWNFTRTNSSVSEVKSTSNGSQNAYYSYVPDGSDASSYYVLEGFNVTFYLYIQNTTTVGTSSVMINVDGVNRTATYLGYNNGVLNYSYTFNVGTISGTTLSKNWTWYHKISYMGSSRNTTLTTVNVTISKVVITDCESGVPSFVYITYDEENGTYLNDSDYSVRVVTTAGGVSNAWSRSVTGQPNITVCIFPSWAVAVADLSLIYSGKANISYSQRTYYNFGVTLSNETIIQPVYLLNETRSYLVTIDTRDQYGQVAPNIVVYFERFNYTSNSYFNVTNVYTTEGGTGLTYLVQYDVPYKITLRDTSGNVLSTYENYFITASSLTLRTTSDITDVYQEFLSIAHSCLYDNSSKVISCSYDDPNSIITRVEFKVIEIFNYVERVICNESKSTFSGEFSCDLSATDNSSKGYYYYLRAYITHSPENYYVLENGAINRPNVSVFGANGVLFALFFFIALFFIGIIKPVVAVMLGTLSIFISYLIGWLDLGTAPIFVFGTLIVIALFVIWRLRE